MLGKPAVAVVSQNLFCAALGMVQLITTCPALYKVMKQELLVCGESLFREFLWLLQRDGSNFFLIDFAFKSVLSFLFSDHPAPGSLFYRSKEHVSALEPWVNCLL